MAPSDLAVSTFSSPASTELNTDVVHLKLQLRDGSTMPIPANTVPYITGAIPHQPVPVADLSLLSTIHKDDMAEPLLSDKTSSTTVSLLLGSDYYWDVIIGQPTRLPSGLALVKSQLGYVLSGQYCNSTDTRFSSLAMSALAFTHSPTDDLSCIAGQDLPSTQNPHLDGYWSLETFGITWVSPWHH